MQTTQCSRQYCGHAVGSSVATAVVRWGSASSGAVSVNSSQLPHCETPAVCCPVGFHSGSIPLAGVGIAPCVVTMSDIEETKRRVAKLESELEQQKTEFEQLREAMVTTAAVERVLLEYGVEPDAVGSIVDDIEAVDSRLGGDDDE